MQALRNASFLARLVLAWFALSLGIAAASPMVKAVDVELVCSAGAAKLLVKTGEDGTPVHHGLDCPFCISMAAPGPGSQPATPMAAQAVRKVMPEPASRIASTVGAPLPARGPPVSGLLS